MQKIREILRIGLPIMLGQACVIILAFADNIMIGWHSVDELAASSFVNNVMNLFILTELGFAAGMTPMIGADNGTGNIKGIGITVKNGLMTNGIIGGISIILLTIIYFCLDHFGQAPELMPYIKPYFAIIGISTLFALGFNVLKQFTDGICRPMISMTLLMIGNLLNIFGNWVLIYGKLGFPEMGLTGAGISTLVSRALILLVFVVFIFKSKKMNEYARAIKEALLSRGEMKTVFKMGYPVGIQMALESSTFTFAAVMAGWLGVIQLAAHQVVITISQLFFLMMQGLSFAVSILVSNAFGRKDLGSVREYARKGYFMTLGISATLSVLLYCFRYQAAGIFTDSPEVSAMAVSLFFLLFAYQFGDGLQLCFANVLRGIQDVRPIMYAAFVSYYLIAIPSAYVLGFKTSLGIHGIWLGFPIGLTLAGIFFYARYRSDLKRFGKS
ncbi:MAG: MATE family efflux transporter [Bacteroidales bacterium]|nr:MATE family efflux transporter [Bacteroidales bacterium]